MGYYRYLQIDFSDFVYDFSDRITFIQRFLQNVLKYSEQGWGLIFTGIHSKKIVLSCQIAKFEVKIIFLWERDIIRSILDFHKVYAVHIITASTAGFTNTSIKIRRPTSCGDAHFGARTPARRSVFHSNAKLITFESRTKLIFPILGDKFFNRVWLPP